MSAFVVFVGKIHVVYRIAAGQVCTPWVYSRLYSIHMVVRRVDNRPGLSSIFRGRVWCPA